ncbi:MAG TPA: hypothetical protein VH092_34555 [Urbifossiella sp.]|jgi:hypothetical protein|nr:hypothetical protein [Urbifossiella sp.]
MADPKDCPACGLVNSPGSVRCDCGYEFAAGRVTGPAAGCQSCGADADTRYVAFHQNIGLFVMRLHSSAEGRLCRTCIGQEFWARTGITLVLGWWGVISFFVTPFILINNIVRYLGCLGMGAPPARKAGGGGGGPPRQLVGQNCALCGGRISSAFDSRYCQACRAPVHVLCTRPGEGNGCPTCGAPAVPKPDGGWGERGGNQGAAPLHFSL